MIFYYFCGTKRQNMTDTIDLSVLILFFNRPDKLQKVFEAVRMARPSRLFLYQDGPRGEQDLEKIYACRKIVENIDWPCQVARNYQEKNAGCDPSGYNAHRWAFSQTDSCLVLEDDVVPTKSYFRFCSELLNKYKDDERIGMITGFNYDETTTDVTADYFFTRAFISMGWASWSRVVNNWQGDYSFWKDPESRKSLLEKIKKYNLKNEYPKIFQDHCNSGKAYFETIFQAHMLLHDQLSIVSRVNMINNIGFGTDSTHMEQEIDTLPKRYRKIYTMKSFNMDFPLKHPHDITDNNAYKERVYLIQAWNHPFRKIRYSLEELTYNLMKGNFRNIAKAIKNRIRKTLGLKRYC